MNLRPYQSEAVAAVYEHLRTRDDNPCVVLPTGTGKSLVLGQIASDAVTLWRGRVLILAHVKELLEQNADKIRRLCPGLDVGVYSAGLNSRDTEHSVIVAGIQSVYRRACELGAFDLIIVDEAHLIPPDGDGMYRTFLDEASVVNPNVRVIGMTATPYRLKGGEICAAENILNHVCYEAGLKEMIVQGFLSPLRSKGGVSSPDISGVHVRGGEFIASEMEAAMDQDALVRAACQEIVDLTAERRAVLIFAAGVAHCMHVAAAITDITGETCGVVTGNTPADERAATLEAFQSGRVKYLSNVNVLTTGFDATNTDCIVLLRPTLSTGLYVQMVGRGTRLHPGKDDCLVLDYGGNVLRHGPVDAVEIPGRGRSGSGGGDAPAKQCANCQALVHAAYQVCPECGAAFPPPERAPHDMRAGDEAIMSGEVTDTEERVHGVVYSVHTKRGADDATPKTMRVEYRIGWHHYLSEWVCPEHTGWARQKFVEWWTERSVCPPPTTAAEAVRLAEDGALAAPESVTVRTVSGEKFDRVIGYMIGEIPDYRLEPGWNDVPEAEAVPAMAWDDSDEIPF